MSNSIHPIHRVTVSSSQIRETQLYLSQVPFSKSQGLSRSNCLSGKSVNSSNVSSLSTDNGHGEIGIQLEHALRWGRWTDPSVSIWLTRSSVEKSRRWCKDLREDSERFGVVLVVLVLVLWVALVLAHEAICSRAMMDALARSALAILQSERSTHENQLELTMHFMFPSSLREQSLHWSTRRLGPSPSPSEEQATRKSRNSRNLGHPCVARILGDVPQQSSTLFCQRLD